MEEFIKDAIKANGATFIVSSKKVYNEVNAFINYGVWHSAKWLSTLLFNGANVYNVCSITNVPNISGDIVIANYNLLPESEKEIINDYKNGKVIKVEYDSFENRKKCLFDMQKIGYQVGTGNMIGVPEQTDDIIAEDLLFFVENNFHMFGLGPYIIHTETPIASQENIKYWNKNKENIFNLMVKIRMHLVLMEY